MIRAAIDAKIALSVALATTGTVREARGVDFDQVDFAILNRQTGCSSGPQR